MTGQYLPLQIAADHPALPGHFPGHPILPGAVLLDEVLHLIAATTGGSSPDRTGECARCRIDVVKFHHSVLPGQALQLHLQTRPPDPVRFELWTQGKPQSPARMVMSGVLVT